MGGSNSAGSGQKINCPAGQWTNVIWIASIALHVAYKISIGAASADWRRYGVGIPPYWQGSFTGSDTFNAWYWDIYLRVDIKPNQTVVATITPA
jgi:hypothetical protein